MPATKRKRPAAERAAQNARTAANVARRRAKHDANIKAREVQVKPQRYKVVFFDPQKGEMFGTKTASGTTVPYKPFRHQNPEADQGFRRVEIKRQVRLNVAVRKRWTK